MSYFFKHRKMFWIGLMVLSAAAILLSVAFGLVRYYEFEPIRRGEFSHESWDKYPQYRHYMAEDMEKKIDIWSLSRKEIICVLGTNAASMRESGTIKYKISDGFAFSRYYTILFTEDDERVTDIFIDYDF